MMAAWGKFTVGLVLVLMIGIGATSLSWFPGSIESAQNRLQRQAEFALADNGGDWAQITLDGQKAVLTGVAPSPNIQNETILAVKGAVWHGGLIVGGVTAVDLRANTAPTTSPNETPPTIAIAQTEETTTVPVEAAATTLPVEEVPIEVQQTAEQSIEEESDVANGDVIDDAVTIAEVSEEAIDNPQSQAPTPEPSVQEQCLPALEEAIRGSTITFASARAEIDAPSRERLLDIADAMTACPDVRLQIAGHTDSRGGATGNLRLSLYRADAVATYLRTVGINENRLQTSGFGESAPIASNNTPRGRAQNRRIEFTLVTDELE